ncbi:MAG: AzlD domain-containing protein [Anaerolineae bacterium]
MEDAALWVILGLAGTTFLLRYVPFATLARLSLPAWLEEWLRLVPGAVLAAMLAQTLLLPEGEWLLPWRNAHLLAAIPAILVAWRTRSIVATMVVGVGGFALLNLIVSA